MEQEARRAKEVFQANHPGHDQKTHGRRKGTGESADPDMDVAHPPLVLGMPDMFGVGGERVADYIMTHGQEFPTQTLPKGVHRGTPKECYKNASTLVLHYPEQYRYAEGFGYIPGTPFAFLHAWAVDKAGKVVDPTWDRPEKCRYFGVLYDTKKYIPHVAKTKMYGVFGGSDKGIKAVLEGKDLR